MYSILNTLSEYTYFYISKNITSKIVESLQCHLKMEVLVSSDYCTVSKTMLLITLSRLPFLRMLILPYVADGDTFTFANDDILIISWGSAFAVNQINNVYVFYNRRAEQFFFSKITEDVPTESIQFTLICNSKC